MNLPLGLRTLAVLAIVAGATVLLARSTLLHTGSPALNTLLLLAHG